MSEQRLSGDIEKSEFKIDDGTEYFVLWKEKFSDFTIVALQTKETPTSVPMRSKDADWYYQIVNQRHYKDLMRRFEEIKKQKQLEHNSG